MWIIVNSQRGFCIGPGGFESEADAWAWYGKTHKTPPSISGFRCVWVDE